MIENVAWMTPGQAGTIYRTPTYDGSLWGKRVCRCSDHIDPHVHTRMHPYGRSIFEDDELPLRPPPAHAGVHRDSATPEDNPWLPLLALLALFATVFAAGCAVYGWPLG